MSRYGDSWPPLSSTTRRREQTGQSSRNSVANLPHFPDMCYMAAVIQFIYSYTPWVQHIAAAVYSEHSIPNVPQCDPLSSAFTMHELTEAMSRTSKASGPDGISYQHLQAATSEVHLFLLDLFNLMRKTRKVPKPLKESTLFPLVKSTQKSAKDVTNHRLIALQQIILKVFCYILNKRAADHIFSHQLLSPAQAGFARGRNCSEHTILLSNAVEYALEKNFPLYISFFDIAKAFPSTPICNIAHGLARLGLSAHFVELISDILSDRVLRVQTTAGTSSAILPLRGTAEGSVESPICFVSALDVVLLTLQRDISPVRRFFMRPVSPSEVCPSAWPHLLAYADDINALSNSHQGAQEQASLLSTTLSQLGWHMRAEKTHILAVGDVDRQTIPPISLDDHQVPIKGDSGEVRQLGVHCMVQGLMRLNIRRTGT